MYETLEEAWRCRQCDVVNSPNMARCRACKLER